MNKLGFYDIFLLIDLIKSITFWQFEVESLDCVNIGLSSYHQKRKQKQRKISKKGFFYLV